MQKDPNNSTSQCTILIYVLQKWNKEVIVNSTTILSQYFEQPASLKMRGRWDHGYHHKYYKSKSFVDLAGSTCWKTCPNAVWGPT